MGLAEIQFPFTWYTINEKDTIFSIVQSFTTGPNEYARPIATELSITPGYYPSPTSLINEINTTIEKGFSADDIRLIYNKINGKTGIHMPENRHFLMEQGLAQYLGFANRIIRESQEAEYVCDIKKGFNSIYCYCDVLEQRIIGDVTAQLLRVVPIKGRQGDLIIKSYENIQYFPVQKKTFGTIEIDLRDDMGEPIRFESGKTCVTLHFRKKRPTHF